MLYAASVVGDGAPPPREFVLLRRTSHTTKTVMAASAAMLKMVATTEEPDQPQNQPPVVQKFPATTDCAAAFSGVIRPSNTKIAMPASAGCGSPFRRRCRWMRPSLSGSSNQATP